MNLKRNFNSLFAGLRKNHLRNFAWWQKLCLESWDTDRPPRRTLRPYMDRAQLGCRWLPQLIGARHHLHILRGQRRSTIGLTSRERAATRLWTTRWGEHDGDSASPRAPRTWLHPATASSGALGPKIWRTTTRLLSRFPFSFRTTINRERQRPSQSARMASFE